MDAAASDTTNKDMDIEIIEIPSHNIAKPEYAKSKIDISKEQKQQQPAVKLLASNIAAGLVTNLDDDIPIISISDGEDSGGPPATSAEKVKRKRNSVGSATAEDDAHYLLKRRKIKVAGAPKMPLTGYVRYMNERRESLKKELPSKTAIEHTKIIGEEWQKMSDDKKAPYIKAAEVDKQRYLAELNTFLKEHPDVLAGELAKNKQMRKSPGEVGKVVLKEKSQSMGNLTSPNKELNASGAGLSKDNNSPPPPTGQSTSATAVKTATATGLESKNRRKRTPTPTNVGSVNNSNSNNNNTSSNSSNTNNNSNHKINSNTTTTPSVAPTNTLVPTATITTQSANTAASLLAATAVPGEIPIFTNEFLEHNKIFDMELRTLRKSKADLEQQNAVLEKHVENMKFGVEKMTNENDELAEKNRLLELYLEKLKSKLAHALSGLAIPSQPNGATMDNIEKYMCDLYKMATTNTHGPASLNKAKDIIRKLDLQINL